MTIMGWWKKTTEGVLVTSTPSVSNESNPKASTIMSNSTTVASTDTNINDTHDTTSSCKEVKHAATSAAALLTRGPKAGGNSVSSSSCDSCVYLLQDAMRRADSRPIKLLQSMMAGSATMSSPVSPSVLSCRTSSLDCDDVRDTHDTSGITGNSGNIERTDHIENADYINKSKNSNKTDRIENSGNSTTVPAAVVVAASMFSPSETSASRTPPLNPAVLTWRKTPDGVQVRVPAPTSSRPSDTGLPSSREGSSFATATSSQVTHPTQSVDYKESLEGQQHHQPRQIAAPTLMEWMSLSCRICSDTGPEANARAFVMGPHPLSIVVCQNRLVEPPSRSVSSHSATYQKQHATDRSSTFGQHRVSTTKTSNKTSTDLSLTSPNESPTMTPTAEQRKEIDEILVHELMHVYDIRKLQLDLRDCQNLAYSEVRAAREAECYIDPHQQQLHQNSHVDHSTHHGNIANSNNHPGLADTSETTEETRSRWPQVFFPSSYQLLRHHSSDLSASTTASGTDVTPATAALLLKQRRCVRNKALLATNNLFPITGKSCVQAIFEQAYSDHRPFAVRPLSSPIKATTAEDKTDHYSCNGDN